MRRDRRSRELAAIHAAARELGMDDDSYRAMLWTVARVRSAADLDDAGRRAVLDHLRERGWRPRRRHRPRPAEDRAPLLRRVYALLDDRPVSYAEAILRHMYGDSAPARLEWCTPQQLRAIVAALYYDAKRHGRRTR